MGALLSTRYEYARFKTVRVSVDYHVEIEAHRYSVPHFLVGQQLDARITAAARLAATRRSLTTCPRPTARTVNGLRSAIDWGLTVGIAIVDALAYIWLLSGSSQGFPAGGLGHPEDVVGCVVVPLFKLGVNIRLGSIAHEVFIGRIHKAAGQGGAVGREGIRNVFEEDQAEHEVLVLGGIHIGAQFVSGGPQRFFDVVDHVLQVEMSCG